MKKKSKQSIIFLIMLLMMMQLVVPSMVNASTMTSKKPTIIAEDRLITKGSNFNAFAGVKAFDEDDGDITSDIEVISTNVNSMIPGIYAVLYKVTNSKGEMVTKLASITVVESLNQAPIIYAMNQTVEMGEAFYPLKYVTARDEEDGDITHRVTVLSSSVNTMVPGVYSVLYSVTDLQGAKTSKEIKVTIIDGTNQKPIVYAQDQIIVQGTDFKALNGVTAYDKEDGDLTGRIEVLSNNVNTTKAGVYEILYSVTDSKGAVTTKWVSITVKGITNQKPIIYAQNQTVEQGALFDVMNNVTAIDLEDGNLTSRVTVQQNTVNTDVLGTYMVVYTVVDSQDASVTKTIWVTVIPRITPTTIDRVMDTDSSVSGSGEAGGTIEIRNGTQIIASGQVGSDGCYHFVIEKQPEGAIIKAIVTKVSTGQTSHASTRVEKANFIEKPSVETNSVFDVTTKVIGTAKKPASKVFAHWNGFMVGEAIVMDNGSFMMDIPALTANTTITFIAKDIHGNSSESYTVIIQAATIVIQ
ncbi:immunoglobulin-like domain-containing protein [Listeria booriae]|uniref:DUF5011 domain-containing protein n=1 Tax=Listeria booriae TaxID=1552123 RepID=A0A7X0XIB5_9LIST|nr:immunoglobulin-like domain-containing protein [Listeria booriae]MBC1561541.1 DUF5011 domain-containing protein [Listeria booriae]MBC1574030.1 DUF5011 domain-containing protein [Listeria booriae]